MADVRAEAKNRGRLFRQIRDFDRAVTTARELVATMRPGDRRRVIVVQIDAPNNEADEPHVRVTIA